ncbi:MAG: hypothetical protein AAGJ69_08625 [Cyanobacteria bacterium J06559_1]
MKPSKAVQLSAVLTLSAIVSGCTTMNVNAANAERASLDAATDEQRDIQSLESAQRQDFPGEDYYQDQQRFFDSDFDYDDAATLAAYWGESIDDSKARIGDKLTAADGVEIVGDILEEAKWAMEQPGFTPLTRQGPEDPDRRAYLDSSFTYEDAETLAAFWDTTIDEAKAHIGRELGRDEGFDVVSDMLQDARRRGFTPEIDYEGYDTPTLQAIEAKRQVYFESDYSYADAELLADYWEMDVYDAKVRIGDKLMNDDGLLLDSLLADFRQMAHESGATQPRPEVLLDPNYQRQRQAYFDSDYSFNDATLLADFWGIHIDEAKARMGRKILWGEADIRVLNNYLAEATRSAANSEQ